MNKALIIAAHPDDEVLGCGGTIAKLADEGWEVHVAILAEGETSRHATRNPIAQATTLSELANSARRAGDILGARSIQLGQFPDNRMDGVELLDVVKYIETLVETLTPSRVFTHNYSDVNIDHRIVHDAVIAAVRPIPSSFVRELFFFEVASSTEWRPATSMRVFAPTMYVDIGQTLQRKLEALNAYASEMRLFPHPRSIEAISHLAHWRGSTVGCDAAEAFEVGRLLY